MKLLLSNDLNDALKTAALQLELITRLKFLTTLAHTKRVIMTLGADSSLIHIEQAKIAGDEDGLVVYTQRNGRYYCAGVRFNHTGMHKGTGQLGTLVVFGTLPEGAPVWDKGLGRWHAGVTQYAPISEDVDLQAAMMFAGTTMYNWVLEGVVPQDAVGGEYKS